MKPPIPKLDIQYRRPDGVLPELGKQLDELCRFAAAIVQDSALFARWYLGSEVSEQEALNVVAIDKGRLNPSGLEALRLVDRAPIDSRAIGLWNGATGRGEGATLSSMCSVLGRPDWFEFDLRLYPEVTDWKTPARWITTAVSIWPTALFASFAPARHSNHRIFQDRPGVGWMIYLPRTITPTQLPEARELVPVAGPDGTRRGTIVVSVTDGPYSDDNPEHLAAAHAIETRLVDQDLLPRYADL